MTNDAVLRALVDELNAVGSVVYIGWNKVQQWPEGALEAFTRFGLLSATTEAQSLECRGCESRCFLPVELMSDENGNNRRAFMVCMGADMQATMGRMSVQLEQLRQWKVSINQLATAVADLLGFENIPAVKPGQAKIPLGMLKGEKGRRWVSLLTDPICLEVNGHEIPLREALYFEGEELAIDQARISHCLSLISAKEGKSYTPSTDRREAGKMITQAMYQDWRDECAKLEKANPDKNDSWISNKIAKMPIAKGRSAGRIRKMMRT